MRPAWLDLNADETAEDVVLPVEVRVKQGMALLDEKHGPEWVQRIDVDSLDLANSCACVIGQLYGDYDMAAPVWIWDQGPVPCGFMAKAPYADHVARRAEFGALTAAWKHAILARRMEREVT